MPIDYSRCRSLTVRAIVRALERDGFVLARQRGSHRRYIHEDGRRVTVPFHGVGETLTPRTLRSIMEDQARWDDDDLKRLGLI